MISIIYAMPTFFIVGLMLYFISQGIFMNKKISSPELQRINIWLMAAAGAFTTWAIIHLYGDFSPFSVKIETIMHYIIGHGFLLLCAIFCGIAGYYMREFSRKYGFN